MSKMFFIPGMKPGHVKGAAGSSAPKTRGPRLVSGSAFAGNATPRNLVPYEEPRLDTETKARKAREARAKDVAEALHFHRDSPASAQEKLAETRAAAESVKLDD